MPPGKSRQGPPPAEWRFCREGEFWTIAYDGRLVRLKDARGMQYLAQLLAHPGQQFHVRELAAAVGWRRAVGDCDGSDERARKAVTNRIRQSLARIAAAHPAAGLHLRNAVHTGTVCSYTPDRLAPWCFEPIV
jgi:hypothetical protein